MTRQCRSGTTASAVLALAASLTLTPLASAQQGIPLPGSAIPKWVDPLPDLYITGASSITLSMEETRTMVMPTGFVPAVGTYDGTVVWRYFDPSAPAAVQGSYIGPVVLATRGVPTTMRFQNDLGTTATSQLNAWLTSTDQTLHWAAPMGHTGNLFVNYEGPIPATPHLHGGEVPPQVDGGPDAWFTGDILFRGTSYYSFPGALPNECIYRYPNTQEAAPIWFHDHALGITRLNVYAGLAGAYLIKDDALTLPAGLTPFGLGTDLIVPLVIQDRMFDTNGQLYFPNVGINPEHPFWVPEFVGDAIVINGKVWPTFGTAAAPKPSKRYRFLFLNGSNARAYEMFLVDPITKVTGPPMWVIGNDGGYLDAPVKLDPNAVANNRLVMLPGERYDVIVDFNDPAWRAANPAFSGQLILRNIAGMPYPKGAPPNGATVGQLLKLCIGAPVPDTGYDPASLTPLRTPMVRLANPANGTAAVAPAKRRMLTLNEFMGVGGPLEVLVNNTKWGGKSVATDLYPGGVRPDFTPDPNPNNPGSYLSEFVTEGEVEQWDLINLTVDAHPIHLHLAQFQVLNRQNFNTRRYTKVYDGLFPATSAIDPMTGLPYPGGVFIGAYGPPLDYNTGNPVALGGNPDVTPYLQGPVMPPRPQETGWKDTVMALPGEVTRILVRWAPTDLPATTPAANAWFPFDPRGTGANTRGFVWHCHIIDHEDNEMMRPDSVIPNPAAVRTLLLGVHY